MNKKNQNYSHHSIGDTFLKKSGGFFHYMKRLTLLRKIRSSRGYGSRKSAYSYYIRNI